MFGPKPPFPVAFVAAGNIKGDQYHDLAETFVRLLESKNQSLPDSQGVHREFEARVFGNEEDALAFLASRRSNGGMHRGSLVFLSGSKAGVARKLATEHRDIHVVVFTGMASPKGEPTVVHKLWVSLDTLPNMVRPI